VSQTPSLEQIRAAAMRIAGHVHRTPVVASATLDAMLGAQIHFKCENLQKVGAFKARGATNAVFSLDESQVRRGVITHSSGNHAAALAFACRLRGAACTIVMPRDAPRIKVDAVRGYGAEIVFCERDRRDEVCGELQRKQGSTLVHPFTDPAIIAGQGTAALELLEQVGPLDIVLAPVGGGGLLSGTAIVVKELFPETRVIGAEPFAVDDAYRSLESGELQPTVEGAQSWGDGLMTGLGALNFRILSERDVEIVRVEEDEMVAAARFIVERMKLVVEPSAATVLAAMHRLGAQLKGKRVGAILSGGNTDFAWMESPLFCP
jgi:threonine dehydratase